MAGMLTGCLRVMSCLMTLPRYKPRSSNPKLLVIPGACTRLRRVSSPSSMVMVAFSRHSAKIKRRPRRTPEAVA
jgi:hypothetical protein